MADPPDNEIDNRSFIIELYDGLLGRKPREKELDHWINTLQRGMPEREIFHRFLTGPEYKTRNKVKPGHPAGHFYSPVVNPNEVREYWKWSKTQTANDLAGLSLDLTSMSDLWSQNSDVLRNAPFEEEPGEKNRYHYKCGFYPKGDALLLMLMINISRPARIVEIGSGFSTAVMLDTADHFKLDNLKITCIEPYADRLRALLRPEDHARTEVIEAPVQSVDIEIFSTLNENDILFIDSSHVLKTGSDVHFELFSILPVLKPGVRVHFHDIQFPFEYPAGWVFNNAWSWNEIYAVRAFLMYNPRFQIEFFTDYFLSECTDVVTRTLGPGEVVGGSLWLRVR